MARSIAAPSTFYWGTACEPREFHWFWTATNTGLGGTGRPVALTGHEEWTFSDDGPIQESRGHHDEAEYQRQLEVSVPE